MMNAIVLAFIRQRRQHIEKEAIDDNDIKEMIGWLNKNGMEV
ncbi:MAG: hypothetical protein OXE99_06190 [Cellvibrionales bacterium]|nr:hypothetical protein [Cellvibrionales bacterium]